MTKSILPLGFPILLSLVFNVLFLRDRVVYGEFVKFTSLLYGDFFTLSIHDLEADPLWVTRGL